MYCRFCHQPLRHKWLSLRHSPLANAFLIEEGLRQAEPTYPLEGYVCEHCWLVQLDEFEPPEHIFGHYLYFSSYSSTWLQHCQRYAQAIVGTLGLNSQHRVVEIASNDGYLLQYFQDQGIQVLGIEPAANVAAVAQKKGIPTEVAFFNTKTAQRLKEHHKEADLLVANNVLAHVPNLNDFVAGLKILLRPEGIMTAEFPHLMQLMNKGQFDTVYHEHFSYFSLLAVEALFAHHGLTIFDVVELPTHGGSMRIYAKHQEVDQHPTTTRVTELREREIQAGYRLLATYLNFQPRVDRIKRNLLRFLLDAKEAGKQVVGYGAPAKGNTLLNYCGVGADLITYTVDKNPDKQNHYLPGSHLPIFSPDIIYKTHPDFLLILPWNLKEEIMDEMSEIKTWGGKFVVAIPEIAIE